MFITGKKGTIYRISTILMVMVFSIAAVTPFGAAGMAFGMTADTTAPSINTVKSLSSTQIEVVFTEALDKASAENASNYECDRKMGKPASAVLSEDGKTVVLTWAAAFTRNNVYKLKVSNIEDLSHNKCSTTLKNFATSFSLQTSEAAPKVLEVKDIAPMTLKVIFDKAVDKISAEDELNYSVAGRYAYLATLESDNKTVTLIIPRFQQNDSDFLNVKSIKGLDGNMLITSPNKFTYSNTNNLEQPALVKFCSGIKVKLLDEKKAIEEQYALIKNGSDQKTITRLLLKLKVLDEQLLEITTYSYTAEELEKLSLLKTKLESEDTSIKAISVVYLVMKDNTTKLDTLPVVKSGIVMVPVKPLSDTYEASSAWDGVAKKFTLKKGTNVVELKQDSNIALINGKAVTMEESVLLINDRLYAPIKFLSEQLGIKYRYESSINSLIIE